MAKKFGKVVLFSLIAGATAAGVYHYLNNKNKSSLEYDDFDDFDDLDNFDDLDDLDDDSVAEEKRSYVSLDAAKAFAGEAVSKAKSLADGAVSMVKDKIAASKATIDEEFDIEIPNEIADEIKEEAEAETQDEVKEETTDEDVTKTATEEASTEEFFDDDEA